MVIDQVDEYLSHPFASDSMMYEDFCAFSDCKDKARVFLRMMKDKGVVVSAFARRGYVVVGKTETIDGSEGIELARSTANIQRYTGTVHDQPSLAEALATIEQ
jgi:hypothetical protein